MITVNMSKARDIWRDELRQQRVPLLQKSDVDFIRALESGDPKAVAAVSARKNDLRNVTQHEAISAAETVDDLMALTLDTLLSK